MSANFGLACTRCTLPCAELVLISGETRGLIGSSRNTPGTPGILAGFLRQCARPSLSLAHSLPLTRGLGSSLPSTADSTCGTPGATVKRHGWRIRKMLTLEHGNHPGPTTGNKEKGPPPIMAATGPHKGPNAWTRRFGLALADGLTATTTIRGKTPRGNPTIPIRQLARAGFRPISSSPPSKVVASLQLVPMIAWRARRPRQRLGKLVACMCWSTVVV